MKSFSQTISLCLSIFPHAASAATLLEESKTPPMESHPTVWWRFMDDHVSREGIAANLDFMKRSGLSGRAVHYCTSRNRISNTKPGEIIDGTLAIAAPSQLMLFSYFRDNGKDGVFLATSEDGTEFKALNDDKPIFTPPKWPGQNLTRDPSIIYHDGMFHMVWTSNWTGRIFGHASSKNLADWSEPIQVRPFSESLPKDDQPDNVWAPEIHHDPVKDDFFILFASTTPREKNDDDASNNNGRPSSQYDNRVFITRTRDFRTFSGAKLFFDRGFASIDAVMKPDPARNNWVMVIKCSRDESLKTMPGRNLWLARSVGTNTDKPDFTPLIGPIAGNHSPMFSDRRPRHSMAEGPSLLYHQNTWWLVWDEPAGGHLQLATSPDLETWTHRKVARFPPRAQHGTLFLAPKSAVAWIKQ